MSEPNTDFMKLKGLIAIIKITTIENSGAFINMLYALEGAVQGISLHDLSNEKSENLKNIIIQ